MPETIYQLLFDVSMNLCSVFQGMSPFDVRRERFHDVMLIYARYLDYAQRNKKGTKEKGKKSEDGVIKVTKKNGDVIIMRPAKDDAHW